MQTLRSTLLVAALTAIAATGCSGGSGDDTNNARVRGRVTDEQPAFAPMSNATVTAYVYANGELSVASDSVQTDAQGRYELVVEFRGESVSDVIIEATSGATFEASALVSGVIEAGSEHTAPPMDMETTVEADVYLSARTNVEWSNEPGSGTTSSGLRAMISAELAATVSASADYANDIEACADAIVAALRARAESMATAAIGMTEAQIEAVLVAEAEAQAELDVALDAATDTSAEEAAIDAYVAAVMQIYADAGMTLADVSQIVHAEVHAAIEASASATVEVREEIVEQLEQMRAEIVAQANAAYFVALGAASQLQSDLDDARVTLEAAIEASAGVQAEITTAWASYSAYVEGELRAQLGTMQAGADTALDTVNATIATAESTLDAALTAAGNDVDAICAAHGSFRASVEAAVVADATIGSMASAHVEATAAILVNAHLAE